jgi:hypothetical protein
MNKKNDGKPLSTDISGKYKYNINRNEYIFLKKTFNSKEKKPYNIRLADFKECLWVNHTDYTPIQCDYTEQGQYYLFTFNNESYQIPIIPQFDERIGYFVKIQKV